MKIQSVNSIRPVRNSAKAIIIENGKILCPKFIDKDGCWYTLPGGGQEPGENLTDALIRECLEEVSAEIEILDLRFVRDYISKNHEFADEDSNAHQVEFMFVCRLKPDQELKIGNVPDAGQLGFEWLPLCRIEEYRLYPQFLKQYLKIPLLTAGPVYLGDVN